MAVHLIVTADSAELVDPQDVESFAVHTALKPDALADAVARHGVGEALPGGEHVMVEVAALRRLAAGRVGPRWEDDLNGMIAYARGKGWTNDDASAVRAHVER